jgi:hypothetical protein
MSLSGAGEGVDDHAISSVAARDHDPDQGLPRVRRIAGSATVLLVAEETHADHQGADLAGGPPVSVATVTSRLEAELVAGFLRSRGLRAAVVTDDAGGQEPQLQLQSQGVRVLVAPSDEASARRLLESPDDDGTEG